MVAGAQSNGNERLNAWLQPHRYQPQRRYFDVRMNPWHYTDWGGLEGIVSSHVLWATESGGLNDPSEVTRAANSLLCTWEQALDRLVPDAPKEDADAWLRDMTGRVSESRFFFVSACLDGDKLQHWRSYARGRGYAIELDLNTEFRILGPQHLYRPGFAPNPWWRMVTYGDYDVGRSQRGGSLIHGREGIMEIALNEFAARSRGERPDEQAFWEHLEANYVSSVCFNKHHAYADEEETRLAFVDPPFADFVHMRSGGYAPSRSTAYLKVVADESDLYAYSIDRAPQLPIKSVKIGPRYGTEIKREIDQVTRLLRDHGYVDVDVTVSDIPYRS